MTAGLKDHWVHRRFRGILLTLLHALQSMRCKQDSDVANRQHTTVEDTTILLRLTTTGLT